jgi:hypothetical protein
LTDGGTLQRYTAGQSGDWKPAAPGDDVLRPAPGYQRVVGAGEARKGRVYAYDPENARILAFGKGDGKYLEQYRLAEGDGWKDLRDMYVVAGVEDQPWTLVWLSVDGVHQAVLVAAPGTGSPDASGSPAPSGAAPSGGSPAASGAASGVASPAP